MPRTSTYWNNGIAKNSIVTAKNIVVGIVGHLNSLLTNVLNKSRF